MVEECFVFRHLAPSGEVSKRAFLRDLKVT